MTPAPTSPSVHVVFRAFDAELLFIANRLGLKIAEVPVRWINSEDTRVRMFTDGLGMVRDLWRIRRMHHGLRRK